MSKLKGIPWSAKDDIESLLYIAIWMLFGGQKIWGGSVDTSYIENDTMNLSERLRR